MIEKGYCGKEPIIEMRQQELDELLAKERETGYQAGAKYIEENKRLKAALKSLNVILDIVANV